jgi:hypothetical protein
MLRQTRLVALFIECVRSFTRPCNDRWACPGDIGTRITDGEGAFSDPCHTNNRGSTAETAKQMQVTKVCLLSGLSEQA